LSSSEKETFQWLYLAILHVLKGSGDEVESDETTAEMDKGCSGADEESGGGNGGCGVDRHWRRAAPLRGGICGSSQGRQLPCMENDTFGI
jgi:hypothetical protein